MQVLLGLDNGGTTTKAALYSLDGREIGSASVDTKVITEKPGFVERDMEEMWEANCTVIKTVLQKTGISPDQVIGVGVCGHGKGVYLWGKDDKPIRHGIISTDNRAWRYPLDWRADGTEEKAFALSCQHILASQPVSLLAWLRDNEPDAIPLTQWIFECKDYIRFRLTGIPLGERTDYSGTNLMNLHTGEYDRQLLDLFGLAACFDKLPPLCFANQICGGITKYAAERTGLREGTPVSGGAFDIDACAVAVNVTDDKHICMIAGTWSINEYVSESPIMDGSVLMNSFFVEPEKYLIEESSPTSAGNLEWFIRSMLPELAEAEKDKGQSLYGILNRWVEEISYTEICPIFLPFTLGSNVHPNARGSFLGISAYHTRGHLIRGIYEGIAFSHRYHYEKLIAGNRISPKTIRLAGGVARSTVWTQMFADVMKTPVEVVEVNETGCSGSAIITAAAIGCYDSLDDAAAKMSHISSSVAPRPDTAVYYDEKYRLYLRAIESLDSFWITYADYGNAVQ